STIFIQRPSALSYARRKRNARQLLPGQAMKITRVECLPVHSGWRKNFVFVRLETDSGIVGWGEAYSQYDRDSAVAAQGNELGRYLIGRDPFQIRHILQIAFDDYAQRRGAPEFYFAPHGIRQGP